MKQHFDFHKYPRIHPLFDEGNKMKVLLMKDELDGKIMVEYVGLKPKMYSMKFAEYANVPADVQQQLLKTYEESQEEED